MLNIILAYAEKEDLVRAVLLNGSRVNPNVLKDPFQDYDIVYLVTEVEKFRNEDYVVPHFGDVIVVEQPLIGPWPPDDADGSYYNYNIQLLDGNRIDVSFYHVNKLNELLSDSLTTVLVDKDNLIPTLPPSNENSYFIKKPTQKLYDNCCTGFLFALGSHIPKTIWRKKLPLLKFHIEAWLRQPVVMMMGWEIGLRRGWNTSLGSCGRYLACLLEPDMWNDYKGTYVDFEYGNLWESLFLFLQIFSRSAIFVAKSFGYRFPYEKADKVKAFLDHVHTLPDDAEQIY
ncbi:MAG: aminoglycoside 6-adenylyltransferase [Spirochaetales bacterium]|jgi:aminoglycoside 6-adenylyltransferase|nr:aminoglycoside 6-adenylyltransferase [Spirochaetales bacterium]